MMTPTVLEVNKSYYVYAGVVVSGRRRNGAATSPCRNSFAVTRCSVSSYQRRLHYFPAGSNSRLLKRSRYINRLGAGVRDFLIRCGLSFFPHSSALIFTGLIDYSRQIRAFSCCSMVTGICFVKSRIALAKWSRGSTPSGGAGITSPSISVNSSGPSPPFLLMPSGRSPRS